jgi:hypothetical protein
MLKICFMLFFQLLSLHSLYGSVINEPDTIKPGKENFIYFTGSLPMFSGYYTINYERELFTGKSGTINLAAGFGGWSNWNNAGSVGMITTYFILGTGKHHFDSGIGVSFHNDKSDFVKIAPVQFNIHAGYRRHERMKPFIFRAGAGWPMLLYTSIGFAF